ncbi:MAG TPA: hypothetical protein VM509_15385 [Planctomycetota bacterium]|nr:hypothetical protein [Planctomycetota bacterium]
MNKPMLGLCLGTVLGAIDGASAYFYPFVREQNLILGIVLGSTCKGLVAGLVTGFIARKLHNVPLGIVAGLLVFAAVTYPIAIMKNEVNGQVYFYEIMIPGAICGAIVGYATQRHGAAKATIATGRAGSAS